ncbi:MAG: serine/threonine protein kinase [Pirellulales bacterium]|nr:serine/threonine protein kinase [Pirellulales bacterium]
MTINPTQSDNRSSDGHEVNNAQHHARASSSHGSRLSRHPELAHLQDFIDAFDAVLHASSVTTERADAQKTNQGDFFGRFALDRMLGSGGFGTVFLAFDPMLGRQVALKLPRVEVWQSQELHDRFLREGRAAAGLDHPNILPVYESGELAGLGFIVSAYCAGPTLGQWMEQEQPPRSPKLAARLVMQLARGVHHAHERGVLHRDIKPSNVLLEPCADSRAADSFMPRLTDFGLAKQLNEVSVDTAPGIQAGTPRYMAPEQLASDGKRDIGVFTDVYALGVVLYEVLADKPPFDDANPFALARAIQEDEPTSIRSVRPDIPRDLETICLKCLEKDKTRRYGTARELADDLERFLDGHEVTARPLGFGTRFLRRCRQHRLVTALVSLLVVGSIVGLGSIFHQWRSANRYAAAVEASLIQAEQGLVNMSWVIEEMHLWTMSGDPFFTGNSDQLRSYYERMLARPAPLRPSLAYEATMQSFHARVAELANHPEEARRHFRESIDSWVELIRREPTNQDYRQALAANLFSYGAHLRRHNELDNPLAQPYEYLVLYRYLLGMEPAQGSIIADFAGYLLERGKALSRAGETPAAHEQFHLAVVLVVNARGKFPRDERFTWIHAVSSFYLACSSRQLGLKSQAIQHFTGCNNLLDEMAPQRGENAEWLFYRAEASRLQAACMRDSGNTDEAISMFETALHFFERMKNEEGESQRALNLLASTSLNLAELYKQKNKPEYGILNYERFCDYAGQAILRRSVAKRYAERLPKVLLELARNDLANGRDEDANRRLIFACEALAYIDPPRDAHAAPRLVWAECLGLRAELAKNQGRIDEALNLHRSALEVLDIDFRDLSRRQRVQEQVEHHRAAIQAINAAAG